VIPDDSGEQGNEDHGHKPWLVVSNNARNRLRDDISVRDLRRWRLRVFPGEAASVSTWCAPARVSSRRRPQHGHSGPPAAGSHPQGG
jgi:hypothetical protein